MGESCGGGVSGRESPVSLKSCRFGGDSSRILFRCSSCRGVSLEEFAGRFEPGPRICDQSSGGSSFFSSVSRNQSYGLGSSGSGSVSLEGRL